MSPRAGNTVSPTWIGCDLDGTLAMHESGSDYDGSIGRPVPEMVARVKQWLDDGHDVRIVTARVAPTFDDAARSPDGQVPIIEAWCLEHLGRVLPITCSKDYGMSVLYDDRAVQVERNTGRLIGAPQASSGRCKERIATATHGRGRCELDAGHDGKHQVTTPRTVEFSV